MSNDMSHDEKAAAYERIARDAREDKLIAFCRDYEGDSTAHSLIKRLDRENEQLRRDRALEEEAHKRTLATCDAVYRSRDAVARAADEFAAALIALVQSVSAARRAQDAALALGDDATDATVDATLAAQEDAEATLIIRENEARALLRVTGRLL